MIKTMQNGDLDKGIADDERHKHSHFNDVPDNNKMQPQVVKSLGK